MHSGGLKPATIPNRDRSDVQFLPVGRFSDHPLHPNKTIPAVRTNSPLSSQHPTPVAIHPSRPHGPSAHAHSALFSNTALHVPITSHTSITKPASHRIAPRPQPHRHHHSIPHCARCTARKYQHHRFHHCHQRSNNNLAPGRLLVPQCTPATLSHWPSPRTHDTSCRPTTSSTQCNAVPCNAILRHPSRSSRLSRAHSYGQGTR